MKISRWLGDLLFTAILLFLSGMLMYFGFRHYYRCAYPVRYAEAVQKYAAEYEMDPALILGVIRSESSFRPEVQSSVGAKGLMQITEDTFYWIRYRMGETGAMDSDVLFDPETNIRYGTATLSLLLREFNREDTALAAYHAGWGNVSRWLKNSRYSADGETLENIPFDDTRSYVSKVLETAGIYRRLYGLDSP